MYFVKYGNEYLHDPRVDELQLLELSFETEENSCGFCDFKIYPNHPMYSKIRERDVNNPVEVYDDDVRLFSGYIYELGKVFYLDGSVKCKGELDYLNDSIVRPYSTLDISYGNVAPSNVNGYFGWLIDQHNEQVEPAKQFKMGINEGHLLDSNGYIYRESMKYPKTFDEIKEKLLDNKNVGGYLRIRHESDGRYIDYLSEWNATNPQILDFGVNLTDYTQTDDSSDLCTFVIPLGAKRRDTQYPYDDGYRVTSDLSVNPNKEYYTKRDGQYSKASNLQYFEAGTVYYEYFSGLDESDLSLTISGLSDVSLDDGYKIKGDMIYNESAVEKYGWIALKYEDGDLKSKEGLLRNGLVALKESISPKRTIEIKAVDMHLVNPQIKPIQIGEYVRVRSKPHLLDSYYICNNIDLDLNNPENSTYTLGTTFDTLTGQQNKRINKLNSTINGIYEAAEKLSEDAKQNAKGLNELNEALSNSLEIVIISSKGTTFKNEDIATVLIAKVYRGGKEVTNLEGKTIKWYQNDNPESIGSGSTFTVQAGTAGEKSVYKAKLEE